MAAVTRLGLHGGPRSPYGSFAGKTTAPLKSYTKTFTRLGLHGGPRTPYGSFAGKAALVVVEDAAQRGRRRRRRRYSVEVEGEYFIFDSIPEVQSFLAEIRETAPEAAERDISPDGIIVKPPRIKVLTRTGKVTTAKALRREIRRTENVITTAYQDVAKTRRKISNATLEIAELLHAKIKREEDDEEALILFLFTE
jgi:hypothetical protein